MKKVIALAVILGLITGCVVSRSQLSEAVEACSSGSIKGFYERDKGRVVEIACKNPENTKRFF